MDYRDAEAIMDRAYQALSWLAKPDFGLSYHGSFALRDALMDEGVPIAEAHAHIRRWEMEHFDPVELKRVRAEIRREAQEYRGRKLKRTTRILARPRKNREIS